jgi:hypothetical protein
MFTVLTKSLNQWGENTHAHICLQQTAPHKLVLFAAQCNILRYGTNSRQGFFSWMNPLRFTAHGINTMATKIVEAWNMCQAVDWSINCQFHGQANELLLLFYPVHEKVHLQLKPNSYSIPWNLAMNSKSELVSVKLAPTIQMHSTNLHVDIALVLNLSCMVTVSRSSELWNS